MFTPRQKGQLDVYGVWGVWRGQLQSDDSFDFNKAASRIKDSISHLPHATEQDDALLQGVQVSNHPPLHLFFASLASQTCIVMQDWQATCARSRSESV